MIIISVTVGVHDDCCDEVRGHCCIKWSKWPFFDLRSKCQEQLPWYGQEKSISEFIFFFFVKFLLLCALMMIVCDEVRGQCCIK